MTDATTEPNPYAAPSPELPAAEQRTWSVATHLFDLVAAPLGAIIMFFVMRDRGEFVRSHVTTALNFQLTLLIGRVLAVVVVVVGVVVATLGSTVGLSSRHLGDGPAMIGPALAGLLGGWLVAGLGYLVLFAVQITNWIFSIIAAVRAGRGEHYRYPIAIRFVKE